MKLRLPTALLLSLPLLLAVAASAVIIDTGDGSGNTTAPVPDPGLDHIGVRSNGLTTVYLGDGWMLTANHVGPGDVVIGGVLYRWAPGSAVRLSNPDTSLADLLLFRIIPPYPPLADLTIASVPPPTGRLIVFVGNGRNRGADTSWDAPGPGFYTGYQWGVGTALRWGTNFVEPTADLVNYEAAFGTQLISTMFHESGSGHSTHESQAANGDSGGAVLSWNGSRYDLVGIMVGITTFPSQPVETSLYGNQTFFADISVYRDEIVEVMPEPHGALWLGVAFVALLASAGTRRACRDTGCAASSPPRA